MSHNLASLAKRLSNARNVPSANTIWQHYKGAQYHVTHIGIAEATEELQVCYFAVDEPLPYFWIRPLSEWLETVEHESNTVSRFTFVKDA